MKSDDVQSEVLYTLLKRFKGTPYCFSFIAVLNTPKKFDAENVLPKTISHFL